MRSRVARPLAVFGSDVSTVQVNHFLDLTVQSCNAKVDSVVHSKESSMTDQETLSGALRGITEQIPPEIGDRIST